MKLLYSLLLVIVSTLTASAQFVIKSNLLYDATATVNVGIEKVIAPKWSVDVSGNFNAWDINRHKWKHWLVQPEARYWFCDVLSGHFVGAHILGGQYNVGNINADFKFLGTDFRKLKDSRYQGWFGGLGVAYGYDWALSEHWNIEAEIGIGWTYTRFDRFPCAECGTKLEENRPHNYFGPTKLAINLEYIF